MVDLSSVLLKIKEDRVSKTLLVFLPRTTDKTVHHYALVLIAAFGAGLVWLNLGYSENLTVDHKNPAKLNSQLFFYVSLKSDSHLPKEFALFPSIKAF